MKQVNDEQINNLHATTTSRLFASDRKKGKGEQIARVKYTIV